MRHDRKTLLPMAAVLALILALLTACGGRGTPGAPPPAASAPGEEAAPDRPAASQPEAPSPVPEAPEAQDQTPSQPEEPVSEEPQPEASAEPAPEPDPEPEPGPEPEPAPAETAPEDGAYTAEVTLEGGTGRATVESPAALRCENGQFWATIVWSSPNFDYMKVNGEKYPQTNTEGNSTFEIPVAAFDQALDVIADTVAMSEPHEVDYTLTFDSASLQKQ